MGGGSAGIRWGSAFRRRIEVVIEFSCFGRGATPRSKPPYPYDTDMRSQRESKHIARSYKPARPRYAVAADAHLAVSDQCRGNTARLGETRIPEPSVDPLARFMGAGLEIPALRRGAVLVAR